MTAHGFTKLQAFAFARDLHHIGFNNQNKLQAYGSGNWDENQKPHLTAVTNFDYTQNEKSIQSCLCKVNY
mgnify:CR=1 FL=1